MEYVERFSDAELEKIMEEGLIYMCACPAQVAETIAKIRALYRYQMACLDDSDNDAEVHRTIAQSAIRTHVELQDCMERILDIEKWDRTTLTMPAGLRVKQAKFMTGD